MLAVKQIGFMTKCITGCKPVWCTTTIILNYCLGPWILTLFRMIH